MNEKDHLKFGIKVDKMSCGWWSFGVCISHSFFGETYLFINLFKRSIAIGWLIKFCEDERGD